MCNKEENDRMDRLPERIAVHVAGSKDTGTRSAATVRPQRHSILNDAQMRPGNTRAIGYSQSSVAGAQNDINRLCGLFAAIPFCEHGEGRAQSLAVIGPERDANPEQIRPPMEFTWHGTPVCYGISCGDRALGWALS
jgi:hypothetical protein